jgi:hypothetical protein
MTPRTSVGTLAEGERLRQMLASAGFQKAHYSIENDPRGLVFIVGGVRDGKAYECSMMAKTDADIPLCLQRLRSAVETEARRARA